MTSALPTLGERAREAARVVATLPAAARDEALLLAADALHRRCDEVLDANARDLERAALADTPAAIVDRLRLTADRVAAMAAGLTTVAGLADPVGEVVRGWRRPNGLDIRQVRVPLGVVGIIYEGRPNVTSDAAGLCLKSGNAALLRGSSTAITSNQAIAGVLRDAYVKAGVPADALVLVDDTSRESAVEFMRLDGCIDVLIPRGGRSLIDAVRENATVPYIIDGDGNCHVYVDAAADLDMAVAIVVNGKTSRPSVCNATESLVVHAAIADRFLPMLVPALDGVELRGDARARAAVGGAMTAADADDFSTEYLDLVLSVAVVDDLDAAIAHIARHGSGHTEAVVTTDLRVAERFSAEVDAAAVVINASTRFTDGEEYGFGAEIGISTQKLHARGPMGLRELTTTKYVVTGTGQVR
ncbi:MAG TPA: glutamate-5-semialdehyde dehydrogenase [Acidimicrobiales bacterium]|nr:glutamate-5-semialdehyde dehydrogenase [Acidimicrobiales bacterium]